jgi:hypothetical protein
MNFSKFNSNYQIYLRSTLSLKKKSTVASNKNHLVLSSFTFLCKYIEYFILRWKIFLFFLKRNYLFELLRFKEISNSFEKNKRFLIKLKNNRSILLFCFNIPFSFSLIISEIFESIKEKTTYFYKFFIYISLYLLIFFVNQAFVSQSEKNYLLFLLPENQKACSYKQHRQTKKNFFYVQNFRKNIFNNSIVKILFKKLKNSVLLKQDSSWFFNQKISYLTFLSNVSQEKLFCIPLYFRTSLYQKKNFSPLKSSPVQKKKNYGLNPIQQKNLGFFKWFSIYLKLKKNKIFYFFRGNLLNRNTYILEEKNNFWKKEFFQKIDSLLFSLLQPRDLKFLIESLAPTDSLVNELEERINPKNDFLGIKDDLLIFFFQAFLADMHSLPIPNWFKDTYLKKVNSIQKNKNLYRQYNLTSFSKKKVKEIFSLFQDKKFLNHFLTKLFSFWNPIGQISFRNSGLKRLLFFSATKQQPFVFRSYKDAIKLPFSNSDKCTYLNLDTLLFPLKNKSSSLYFFPSYLKEIKQIKLLYSFSSHFSNNNFFNHRDFFYFVYNRTKIISALQTVENTYLYDLDFYLSKNKSYNNLFWIPNSLTQTNILEQENQKKLVSSIQTSNLISFQQDFKFLKEKHTKVQSINNVTKKKLLNKYNDWFFTSEWWLFRKHLFLTQIRSLVENLTDTTKIAFHYFFIKIGYKNKNYLLFNHNFNRILNIIRVQFQYWNKILTEQVYTTQKKKSVWINLTLIPAVNKSFLPFALIKNIFSYYQVSLLTGILYLFFWLDFERIRSFYSPSWNTFLSILTQNSFDSPSQQLRLTGYLSRSRLFFTSNLFCTIYSRVFVILNIWNPIPTVDFYVRNKNIVSNSLITKQNLNSKEYLWNINKNTANYSAWAKESQNGFNFFKRWSKKNQLISRFLPLFESFSWNWLSDLFLYNRDLISDLSNPLNKPCKNWKSKPIPLFGSLTYTQRWLFIGSLESGKFFVIKNLAASVEYPLIHVSIQNIKNATPENKYNKIKKQKRWVEQLSERGFFLENIFNFVKMVSPSILWVSDLHDLDTKNYIKERNAGSFDISILTTSLLKILSIDLVREGQNHITFIGSTEYPKLLDPKFVSRKRLDLIVNFRTLSFNQRQNIFFSILKTKGFAISGLRSYYEFTSNTLGYTFRDITSLINETLLVKTTEKTTLIDNGTIRLALFRQTSIQSVRYKTIKKENLSYKIGKSIVQTILGYPKSIILLSKYYDLWRTKFYYLSNTYLEISNKKAIITEFVLLSQILNCLAGSAARDAWILLANKGLTKMQTSDRGRIEFSLTSQLKHDFSLASNILQSLLVEFSMQDITFLIPKKKKDREKVFKNFHFKFLRKAMSYLEFLDQFPSYINWSNIGSRLSFNWILFFNQIEYSTKNLSKLLFLDKSTKNTFSPTFFKNSDNPFPYQRKQTRKQYQEIQEIDLFFNKLIYTMYMDNLGFPWESQYIMSYNPFQLSLFFQESRPLWNPQIITSSYSILFFDRDLFINQKLLTDLYITYGNKFQIEKLSRERIKKQNLWSSSSFSEVDDVDVNQISAKQNDFVKNNIFSNGTYSFDFYFYQNLISLNGQLDQSQIQFPRCLHDGWITADPAEAYQIFETFATPILLNNDHLIAKESFLYEFLLEIYHYLIKFFIKKRTVINQMHEFFIKKETLCREDIEILLQKYF